MDIRKIDESLSVAPQIDPADMEKIARAGYATLVCNRPDGEEEGQPRLEETRAAAQRAGLRFKAIPVSGGVFPDEAIAAFRAVRMQAAGPVLAYCRTGTRSITLETLANPAGLTVEERLERARSAGYDLSALRARLETE